MRIVTGIVHQPGPARPRPRDHDARLGWLLIVGTIPAGILGLVLERQIRHLFASAEIAAFFLIVNGVMLLGAEALWRRAPRIETGDADDRIAGRIGWRQAELIGAARALALIDVHDHPLD